MRLILARHGNTFDPGAKVVWVGNGEDLPLVQGGVAQALALGESLKKVGFKMERLFCSQLKRTREYARLLVKQMGVSKEPEVRTDLNEIDYGNWGGLSTEEIIAKEPRAKEALEKWEKESAWPEISPWTPGPEAMSAQVARLAGELVAKGVGDGILVSSNGVLRYFLKLVPGEWERRVCVRDFKMKTGHSGVLEYAQGQWKILGWNLSPTDLEGVLGVGIRS
jgi:probable phosphoglycerate mutase